MHNAWPPESAPSECRAPHSGHALSCKKKSLARPTSSRRRDHPPAHPTPPCRRGHPLPQPNLRSPIMHSHGVHRATTTTRRRSSLTGTSSPTVGRRHHGRRTHMLQMHVSKCFRCFIGISQVFYMDVAKIDQDVAHCYKCFRDMLQVSIRNVSDVCCKCSFWTLEMFQWLYKYVANIHLYTNFHKAFGKWP
jgi:hypothetical protein